MNIVLFKKGLSNCFFYCPIRDGTVTAYRQKRALLFALITNRNQIVTVTLSQHRLHVGQNSLWIIDRGTHSAWYWHIGARTNFCYRGTHSAQYWYDRTNGLARTSRGSGLLGRYSCRTGLRIGTGIGSLGLYSGRASTCKMGRSGTIMGDGTRRWGRIGSRASPDPSHLGLLCPNDTKKESFTPLHEHIILTWLIPAMFARDFVKAFPQSGHFRFMFLLFLFVQYYIHMYVPHYFLKKYIDC